MEADEVCISSFQKANAKGVDQLRRLVCAFVVRIQQSQIFSRRGPFKKLQTEPSHYDTRLSQWVTSLTYL